MPHQNHQQNSTETGLIVVVLVLLAGLIWRHQNIVIYILCIVAAIITLVLLYFGYQISTRLRSRRRSDPFVKIDNMDGLEFEHFVAKLLKRLGFSDVTLTERFDAGVDIIAVKSGIRWGIQVKRHKDEVRASAVRQVVTALKVYDCERAMVVTNNSFSKVAQRLADINACVLIDRDGLSQLINEAASAHQSLKDVTETFL